MSGECGASSGVPSAASAAAGLELGRSETLSSDRLDYVVCAGSLGLASGRLLVVLARLRPFRPFLRLCLAFLGVLLRFALRLEAELDAC